MELTPTNWLLLFFKILQRSGARVIKIFSYFTQAMLAFISTKQTLNTEPSSVNQHHSNYSFPGNYEKFCSAAELNVVIDKLLGMQWDPIGSDCMVSAKEVLEVFEEEPSLGEVKEAFDVFDQNRDGFIDETELHRVLCSLGLVSEISSEVETCRGMISAFDENGDGLIDFREFVKFMETCFC